MPSVPLAIAPSAPVEVPVSTSPARTLTALDRCDACGSRAYASATMPGGRVPLLFCGHHFTANEARLRAVAIEVHDERQRLVAEVKAQAHA